MTDVQTSAPTWRQVRGLVMLRMASGQLLTRIIRVESPPPWGAVAWRTATGWSKDFGGRWLERGDGRLFWEWTNG